MRDWNGFTWQVDWAEAKEDAAVLDLGTPFRSGYGGPYGPYDLGWIGEIPQYHPPGSRAKLPARVCSVCRCGDDSFWTGGWPIGEPPVSLAPDGWADCCTGNIVGRAKGLSSALGVGAAITRAVGSAVGSSMAAAVATYPTTSLGVAHGDSTSVALAAYTWHAIGGASGYSVAVGYFAGVSPAVGSASGDSAALGVPVPVVSSVGEAAGDSVAVGYFPGVSGSAGEAQGQASARAGTESMFDCFHCSFGAPYGWVFSVNGITPGSGFYCFDYPVGDVEAIRCVQINTDYRGLYGLHHFSGCVWNTPARGCELPGLGNVVFSYENLGTTNAWKLEFSGVPFATYINPDTNQGLDPLLPIADCLGEFIVVKREQFDGSCLTWPDYITVFRVPESG
jgi:hypothetical protein